MGSKGKLIWTLGLFLMISAVAGYAENPQAIVWLSGSEVLEVDAGETREFTATFYSRQPLRNAGAIATMGLEALFGQQWLYLGDLEANRVYTVRYTIQIPENARKGTYSGAIRIIEAPSEPQPGVRSQLLDLLPVKIRVQ